MRGVLVVLLVATTGVATEGPRVVAEFPPPGMEGFALAEWAQDRLGFTADYVLKDGASRVLAERAPNGTLHVHVDAEGRTAYDGWFEVREQTEAFTWLPFEAMPVGVEAGVEGDALRILAPPGRLRPPGTTNEERAEAWARALGLPPAAPTAWTGPAVGLDAMYYFGPEPRGVGDPPWIVTSCPACATIARGANGSGGHIGRVEAGFAADGSLVWFRTQPWTNLSASDVLPLEMARARVEANLSQGAWNYTNLHFAYASASPDRVWYYWEADVVIPERPHARELAVTQDGITGEVANIAAPEAVPNTTEGAGEPGLLRPVPMPALVVLAAAAVALGLGRAPRRP